MYKPFFIFLSSSEPDYGAMIFVLLLLFGFIALLRYFWMWLIGVNEVINQQKESNKILKNILDELRKNNTKPENL